MECTFPVNGKLKFRDLSVSWEKKDELEKQVYVLLKGEEDFRNQHSDFKGRIKLLKENLKLGQSLLQITDVKLRDAGFYQCVIGYGGADYKTINLKVKGECATAGGSMLLIWLKYFRRIPEDKSGLAFKETSSEKGATS